MRAVNGNVLRSDEAIEGDDEFKQGRKKVAQNNR